MKKDLQMLDEIEEIRQKAVEKPDHYPVDYVARVCASIVARHAGYNDRNTWTGELKKHPDSNYQKRLENNHFHL